MNSVGSQDLARGLLYFRCRKLQEASSRRYRDMRLRHQYIISGLPRDVSILVSGDENTQSGGARKAQFAEHLSRELLWDIVRSGRSLDERYVQHVSDCRDCREFVAEFSDEARSSGLSFPGLLPSIDEKRVSPPIKKTTRKT